MKKPIKFFFTFFFSTLFFLSIVYCASAQNDQIRTGMYEGEFVEYYKNKLTLYLERSNATNTQYLQQVNDFIIQHGAMLDSISHISIWYIAEIQFIDTVSDAINIIDDFKESELFEYVYLTGVIRLNDFFDPNDPRFPNQWYLKQDREGTELNHDVDANKAWIITKGDNTKVRIYIVDTGIRCTGRYDISHEDLTNNYIIAGTDYTGRDSLNDQWQGHGTKIAGYVAGTQNNNLGISGLSPHCTVVIDRVYTRNGNTSVTSIQWFMRAIRNARIWKTSAPNRQAVISISSTGNSFNDVGFTSLLDSARDAQLVIVCSSGNRPPSAGHVEYPARFANTYDNVVSVGATDRDDVISGYSCIARIGSHELTMVAPGGFGGIAPSSINMISTSRSGYSDYESSAGTSFSSPLVAATVGLMFSVKINLTAIQIKSKLIRSIERCSGMADSSYSLRYGYGRLNTFNSLVNSTDSVTNHFGTANTTITLTDHLRIEDLTTIPERCTIRVPTGKVLILDKIANLNFDSFAKIIVENGGSMIQRKLSTIEDRGEILIENGGNYYVEDSADFNLTGQGPGGPNDYGCLAVWGGTLHIGDNATVSLNDGGFLTARYGGKIILGKNSKINIGGWSWLGVEDDAEIMVGENTNILFEDWSWLVMGNRSSIKFGENSGLRFREWSYMYADTDDTSHIYLSGLNSQTRWNGIIFDSTRINDTIEKCVFSEAKTAITIRNSNVSSNVTRIFEDNIFNIPEGLNTKGIYSDNTHKITIEGNTFNMPTTVGSNLHVGIYLNTASTSSTPVNVDPEGAGEDPEDQMVYILNIIHNTFNKGTASMVLANFTSNFLPYYIKSNHFEQPASQMNIFGIKIGGTIKDNVMTSMQTPLGIHLANSNPTLFNNIIPARDVALHLVGHCYPNLAPQISGNQTTWTGGKNQLSVSQFDAVQLDAHGIVSTDYGRNKFLAPASGYHFYGWIDSTVDIYKTRNNCWYRPGNTTANIYLLKTNTLQPVSTITYNYVFDCNSEPDPIEYELDYMGHEIWDSVMISENDIGEQPTEDEQLLIQAMDYYADNQFINAIASYKGLIDNYPSSDLTKDALYNMYSCHEQLDTSSNQDYINSLFGNLNIYLEQKLESDSYDTEFEDVAYDVKLMCESKIQNYNDAMNGYEFIALFHPDPNVRLIASWNYAAVQAILNNGTGGGSNAANLELFLEKKIAEVEKIINENPIMRKLKKSYERQVRERQDLIEMQSNIGSKNIEENNYKTGKANELDKLKIDKAKHNLINLKNLSNAELERTQLEDMFLTSRNFRNESSIIENSAIPSQFKLSQNYPNPFNPSTTINYEIPNDGFVTIKIFDLIGREVTTLVNESKPAGFYQILFNGQSYPSGVYFYKIEVGSFVETKRMVLIK